MPATATERLIGRLDVDSIRHDWVPDGETGSAPVMYWPKGTYLQNDGQMHQWMTEGVEDYLLEYDGVGWVVTRGAWPYDKHTYRLAAGGELTQYLPVGGLTDGVFLLDPGSRYAIRCTIGLGITSTFDLYEIA